MIEPRPRSELAAWLRSLEARDAWDRALACYAPVVLGYAEACGCPGEEAEEVLQETLVRLWRGRAADPDPGAELDPESLQQVVAARIEATRRRAARRAAAAPEGAAGTAVQPRPGDGGTGADPAWDGLWRRNLLHQALAQVRSEVGDRAFRCFELRLLRQESARQVQAETGLPLSTIRRACCRCLDVLPGALARQARPGAAGGGEVLKASALEQVRHALGGASPAAVSGRLRRRLAVVRGLLAHGPGPEELGPMLVFRCPRGEGFRRLACAAVVGSGADAAVQIEAEYVSRCHFRMTRHGLDWLIEDCDSTNGTFVNGRRITRHWLCEGDLVQAGTATLVFLDGDRESERTPEHGSARLEGGSQW